MNTIVITLPTYTDGEAERIVQLLRYGYKGFTVDLLHLRKPEGNREEMENLIRQIPQELHCRLVLHDYHDLAIKYGLYGIHLNSRNPLPTEGWKGSVSRSCHTIEAVKEWKNKCNYVSLSPIFDSISKQGYRAAFSREQLADYAGRGIIDEKVYALGGVTFDRLHEIEEMGFGGALILGDAWK